MALPPEHINVMITYKTIIDYKEQIVTRKAFYSKSNGFYDRRDNWIETPNGSFSIPQFWQDFTHSDGTQSSLPHTFYSYPNVLPTQIIKWEFCIKE